MWKKTIILIIALAGVVVSTRLPLPPAAGHGGATLSREGMTAIGVVFFAVLLWVTEVFPFAVTGCAAVVVMTLTRAASFETLVGNGFGNHIILFFIGVLTLSAAINESGLLRRVATVFLRRFGHTPSGVVLAFLVIGALVSMWITDLAVAAILMPLGVGILRQAGVKPGKSNFAKALMISCAWGPLIGGVATPAGCGPNPLTITYLEQLAGVNLSFINWMILGVPAMILMIPCAWLTLMVCFPPEKVDLSLSQEDARGPAVPGRALGRFTFKEGVVLAVMLLAIFLWVAGPKLLGWTGRKGPYISFVAIGCASLLFLPGITVMSWKRTSSQISWGGLILVATGLSLGMTLYETGAASWIATVAFGKIASVPLVGKVFLVVLGVALIKVLLSSNTVTGTIIVPLMIALAGQLGIDPTVLAVPAGITSSIAFILVTSTPTNVVPYSSGYFSIREMAKAGIWMTIWASVCVTLSITLMGKLFNLYGFA